MVSLSRYHPAQYQYCDFKRYHDIPHQNTTNIVDPIAHIAAHIVAHIVFYQNNKGGNIIELKIKREYRNIV